MLTKLRQGNNNKERNDWIQVVDMLIIFVRVSKIRRVKTKMKLRNERTKKYQEQQQPNEVSQTCLICCLLST